MYFDASTRKCGRLLLWAVGLILILSLTADAQKKSRPKAPAKPKPVDEHAKLREQFIAATNDYKSSLEKLQAIYARNVKQVEDKLAVSRKLLEEGLVSRNQVEENERAVASERDKLAETQRQMAGADAQVAGMLLETKAAEELSKSIRTARGSLTSTTAMIRYQGTGAWSLGDVWKVQKFFVDSFRKPLPIAVLGQGAIHDRWRLDHRNSMDISLHPDGVEGRALLNFLQKNGIPFLAFREAIPGTATGAHIHIGRPSHRY
jgi:hypothetical protein